MYKSHHNTSHILRSLSITALLIFSLAVNTTAGFAQTDAPNPSQTTGIITTGPNNVMAIANDNSLWMWAEFPGINVPHNPLPYQQVLRILTESVKYAAAGEMHTLAIKTDNTLWAWGANSSGQLGNGTNKMIPPVIPVLPIEEGPLINDNEMVKVMDSVIMAAASGEMSMAVKDDGTLWAWGRNTGGLMWEKNEETRLSPVKMMDDVAMVSLGDAYVMALKTDGSVWTWGRNQAGVLGDGSDKDRREPLQIMDSVVYISAGDGHAAAIKTNGSLWMWGDNVFGGVGDGTLINRFKPVKIMDSVVDVAAGAGHTIALKDDGSAWTWGANSTLQLNSDAVPDIKNRIMIMDSVAFIAAGAYYAAVKTDNSLWVWGNQIYNANGFGTALSSNAPVKIMDDILQPPDGGE